MYHSETIHAIYKRLNDTYFLPAIQREFVWKPAQIIRLFDSIMQDYPIGAFLFWELTLESRDRWNAYKFAIDATEAGTHNHQADLVGVTRPVLVLDGQQRLTSLVIGLKGKYTIRVRNNRSPEDPLAWSEKRLYLDLLKNPSAAPHERTGLRYNFQFLDQSTALQQSSGHYWFRVGRVLDCVTEDELYRLKHTETLAAQQAGRTSAAHAQHIDQNLDQLYRRVWKEASISYHLEPDQNYDRVLNIFVRANDGGTKLTKSDLLLSMVTASWDGLSARDEIHTLVEHINKGLARRNDIDKDFVLKCALVVCDLPVAYTVDHFTPQNMRVIYQHWPRVKQAIEHAFRLVNSFGIDRTNLTSSLAMIPIVYYLMRRPQLLVGGSSHFDVTNARSIRKWLALAMLDKLFGRGTDSVLEKTRNVIKPHVARSADFPLKALATELEYAADRMTDVLTNRILNLHYGQKLTFLGLTLLYDDTEWASKPFTQDHIFPKSHFTPACLAAAGVAPAQQKQYTQLADSICNLELLVGQENVEKSNQPFESWITSRAAGFQKRHLIPRDASLFTLQEFPAFVSAREQLIKKRIEEVFKHE